MQCIVTAGPTYEELDKVRRLTNFSTGRLGSELASFLTERGHEVTLLRGYYSTWHGQTGSKHAQTFTTTADLRQRLMGLAGTGVKAVFHAAAVSDFGFGKIWSRSADGQLTEVQSGKLTTRGGALLAELVPTKKIIHHLRDWFEDACIVGWKYEVEGSRETVLNLARRQLTESRTDACVANGSAYGHGFGLVPANGDVADLPDRVRLFEALDEFAKTLICLRTKFPPPCGARGTATGRPEVYPT